MTGEQTVRCRCSATELLELFTLQAGIEPATAAVSREVTASYTTGQTENQVNQIPRRGISEERRTSKPLLCGALHIGTTPPPRKMIVSGRISVPAHPWLAEEVTLFFRHRHKLIFNRIRDRPPLSASDNSSEAAKNATYLRLSDTYPEGTTGYRTLSGIDEPVSFTTRGKK